MTPLGGAMLVGGLTFTGAAVGVALGCGDPMFCAVPGIALGTLGGLQLAAAMGLLSAGPLWDHHRQGLANRRWAGLAAIGLGATGLAALVGAVRLDTARVPNDLVLATGGRDERVGSPKSPGLGERRRPPGADPDGAGVTA
jgi:hypothetical protein